MDGWPYPLWIAHRGAGKLAPENTLAAFQLGAQHGYRMFECDAKLSADDVVFLMHDATLSRTTNARKVFGRSLSNIGGEHAWCALSRLDAGGWHSRSSVDEPLATLESLAHFCLANEYMLNIEIKPTPGMERRTGDVIAREAARLWAGAKLPPLLTSFRTEALQAAQATRPELPRGLLLSTFWTGWLETALSLACKAIVCNHSMWDRRTLTQARSAGLRCLAYTVNDKRAAQRLIDLGIDGIITDRIDLFPPA